MSRTHRAFVTGATGQDGSYLVERLLADGVEVHALVHRGAEPQGDVPTGVIEHKGSLADFDRLASIVTSIEPDSVFNLAGISSVATSWERPLDTVEVSGTAVVALLEACRSVSDRGREVRFVQASSSEIFGAAEHSPQTESTPIRPVSPYGAAKALAHHAVSVYRGRGVFCSAAILYNHESPRRPETFVTRKITRGVARIAAGLETTISLGNLDARRDWGWAPDYVDAMIRISRAETPGDFVIATGETHSVREFVGAAFSAAGIDDWEDRVIVDPSFLRPADVHEMRGDPAKAHTELGWAPTVRFTEIVASMVRNDLTLLGIG